MYFFAMEVIRRVESHMTWLWCRCRRVAVITDPRAGHDVGKQHHFNYDYSYWSLSVSSLSQRPISTQLTLVGSLDIRITWRRAYNNSDTTCRTYAAISVYTIALLVNQSSVNKSIYWWVDQVALLSRFTISVATCLYKVQYEVWWC